MNDEPLHTYLITRTRLVTETFRVFADSIENAFDTLGNADEPSDCVEKVCESTLSSDSEIEILD